MTATTSINAFFYGATESFGETAIAATLTAARYGVLAYDWYTETFFSANAQHVYTTLGEGLGHMMIATILVGRIAQIRYQKWVDATVAECLPTEAVVEVAESDPFAPAENPYYPAMAQAISQPVATLVVKVEAPKPVTSAELRRQCQAAGIRWRNAHGQGRHLSKAEMISALG
jgi:hypothetical protein